MNPNPLPIFGERSVPVASPEALRLLQSLGCESLGGGNIVAGLNTLFSMCASISALAGPGAKVVSANGDEWKVGIHWLVSGTSSLTQHSDRVLDPVRALQNALSENVHLAHVKMPSAAKARRPRTVCGDQAPIAPELVDSSLKALYKDQELLNQLAAREQDPFELDEVRRVASAFLKPGAFSDIPEFARNPAVFHDGSNPKILSAQLSHSHRGHPLVDFPISEDPQLQAVQLACISIMDGFGLPTKFPTHAKGFVTARMPTELLGRAVARGQDLPWIHRMFWLTGVGFTLSESKETAAQAKVVRLTDVQARFEAALSRVLARRLDGGDAAVVITDCRKHEGRVRAHLAKLNRSMPGISTSSLNLFPTLLYGLVEIIGPELFWKRFANSITGIEHLAMYLADRMVHLYFILRDAELNAFKQKVAQDLLIKLADGPQAAGALSRRFNRLPVAVCREVLEELRTRGQVTCQNDTWALPLPDSETSPRIIDVLP